MMVRVPKEWLKNSGRFRFDPHDMEDNNYNIVIEEMSWETLETGWYGDLEDSEKGFGFILCLSWHFLKYYLLKFYHGWNVEMRISFVRNKVNLVRLSVLLMLIKGLCNFRYFTKRGIFLLPREYIPSFLVRFLHWEMVHEERLSWLGLYSMEFRWPN